MRRSFWLPLALATVAIAGGLTCMACKKSVGELQTYDVVADAPGDPGHPAEVHLEMQEGDLHVTPGGVHVVGGAAKTNVSDLAPAVSTAGYKLTVSQGKPGVDASKWGTGLIADYRLTLGTTPMALTVSGGASSVDLELGGLAVHSLTVRNGAGSVRVGEGAPNPMAADTIDVETGAGNVTLTDVGRFGASKLRVRAGAGVVNVSLGSKVEREVSLDLETGAGAVRLAIPNGVSARAEVKSEAGPLKVTGWTKDGEDYVLGAATPNPRIRIRVKTGAGPITFDTAP
ncbi:hypothetical protein LVJ94_36530 [Pendulispora rubella]|uniref:DUF4097 domain-containing protein n=1 Tax=Pendulispora rubella TaxID=2741070 RepID=A0ABZ2KWG2_9BACT